MKKKIPNNVSAESEVLDRGKKKGGRMNEEREGGKFRIVNLLIFCSNGLSQSLENRGMRVSLAIFVLI